MDKDTQQRFDRINKIIAQQELKEAMGRDMDIVSDYCEACLSGHKIGNPLYGPAIEALRNIQRRAAEREETREEVEEEVEEQALSAEIESSIARMRAFIAPRGLHLSTERPHLSRGSLSPRNLVRELPEDHYTMNNRLGITDARIPIGDAASAGLDENMESSIARMRAAMANGAGR